jgi:hypothetical protein
MGDYEKILIGSSIPLMKVDDDEDSTLDENMINRAELEADFSEILNSFGTDEFKEIYLNLYNEIVSLDIEKKSDLIEKLCDKIYEVYNFEFIPKLEFNNENDINEFLKFIEFLEFDYIDFIAEVIKGLDLNLLKKDLNLFLKQNENNLISKVEFIIQKETYSKIISNFFRTNNRNNVLEFLKLKLEKSKMLIILKSIEGESENV